MELFGELFRYGIFGVLTTLINYLTYAGLYTYTDMGTVWANIIAWIAGVLFAFATNRRWVFERNEKDSVLYEGMKFFGCRAGTGIFDIIFVFLFVDKFGYNAYWTKLVSNVFVIIMNYLGSKIWVFRKGKAL